MLFNFYVRLSKLWPWFWNRCWSRSWTWIFRSWSFANIKWTEEMGLWNGHIDILKTVQEISGWARNWQVVTYLSDVCHTTVLLLFREGGGWAPVSVIACCEKVDWWKGQNIKRSYYFYIRGKYLTRLRTKYSTVILSTRHNNPASTLYTHKKTFLMKMKYDLGNLKTKWKVYQ